MFRNQWSFLTFLIGLAIVLRFVTLFPLVIDHDESTYIIIARQLFHGLLPYVDNIDVKPIGIYLLFAVVLKLSSSIWAIRLVAAVSIGLTAYFLGRASSRIFMRDYSLPVGILYVSLASLHKWSWSANTEVFFVLFSSIGLFYLLEVRRNFQYFCLGLILGVGFMFKYHILFDLCAFGILLWYLMPRQSIARSMGKAALSLGGFVVPFAMTAFCYYLIGHFDEFFEATVITPSRYSSEFNAISTLSFIGEFYLSFLPLSLLFVYGGAKWYFRKGHKTGPGLFLAAWLIFGWIGIISTGKHYFHYYFQALPVLCLFLPVFVDELQIPLLQKQIGFARERLIGLIIPIAMITNLNQWTRLITSSDYLKESAEIIRKRLEPGEHIYTNHENVLYFLTDTSPPTKYVHTSLLYKKDLAKAYDINVEDEILNIKAKSPQFYLLKAPIPHQFISEVENRYEPVRVFGNGIILFERLKVF